MSDRDLIELHLTWCLAAGFSTSTTIPDRGEVLGRLSVDLGPLLGLTGEQLSGWLARPGWAAKTRATYYSHMAPFYAWCMDTERLHRNPMRAVPKPKAPAGLPRPVPPDILDRILAEAVQPWLLAALMAAYAGLRCFEVAQLRREDVTEERITLVGKGGKAASIPTHPRIWAAVRDRPAGILVRPALAAQFTSHRLSNRFSEYMDSLGAPDVTLHRLRHSFGSRVYGQSHDLLLTQRLLRHSSPVTTQGYVQLADAAAQAAVWGL